MSTAQVTVTDPPGITRSAGASYSITTAPGVSTGKTLTVTAGTLTFASDISVTYPNLAVVAGAGTALQFAATQHLGSLSLTGGAAAALAPAATRAQRFRLVLGALAIDPQSALNLSNNDMILKSGGLAAAEALLVRGFHNGDWKGLGLTSSTAAADASFTTALGSALAGDLSLTAFDGEPIVATDVLIKYTYWGDADLSGSVTGDDESLVLFGMRQGGAPHWEFGDFDYSGHVTGDDYSLFLAGLRKQPVL
jgi:hypothetical protein